MEKGKRMGIGKRQTQIWSVASKNYIHCPYTFHTTVQLVRWVSFVILSCSIRQWCVELAYIARGAICPFLECK